MSSLLVQQLAKTLDIPAEDVNTAYSELLDQINEELERSQTARIPGLGTFVIAGDEISFEADESLSLAVNNRFGLLDDEMVSKELGNANFLFSSETLEESNEPEIDSSLIDQPITDNIPETDSFSEQPVERTENTFNDDVESILSFDEELFSADSIQTELSSLNTSDVVPGEESASEDVSMKEDDPNSPNHPDQESNDFDTEWSPFFEELEGDEFDVDNTIDLSAEDWESEIPSPSPFGSSDSAEGDADDLYFDVDADPDDTLFSPASLDVDDPASNESSWASTPLDEPSDFFDNDPIGSPFGDELDPASTLGAEDEFFTSVNSPLDDTPDETLFSPESLYDEPETVEADDTIFLAPDQTVKPEYTSNNDLYGNSSLRSEDRESQPAGPPPSRNPYAYREDRKKNKSAWPWVAGILVVFGLIAGVGGYFLGIPPFDSLGGGGTEAPMNAVDPPIAQDDPAVVEPPMTDPLPEQSISPTTDPSANDPVTSEIPTTTQPPVPQNVVQRIGIDRSRGGWTIVVTSEIQRVDAERIADNFAQTFEALRYPIDILTTDQFTVTRYRVGVGQFDSRQAAMAAMRQFDADLPDDAWLLRIES